MEKKVKNLEPIFRILPSVMIDRSDAQVYFKQDIPLSNMDEYIDKKAQDGIRMSFDEHGVSGADAYLTRTAAGGYVPANYEDPVTSSHSMDALGTVSIAWDESGDFKTNLEQIITQKYIALYPVGQEAWTEFRRTGYPKVFPVVVNESSGGSVDTNIQIRRLPYPESEYNTNRTELDKGITLLGGVDNPGVRLWWDVPNK